MDATQIKRAKEVFQLVVDLPDEQRESLLTKHCAGDADLRAFVQELLSHDAAGMGEFMCKPVVASSLGDSAGVAESLPDRIGRYEVVRLIGEGGMGTVYEARQEQPQRTVALKVIRSGLPSTEMLRRFQHEGEILGQLQHPGIACIHEAGMAEISSREERVGRQPFFAMELVRGKPLSEYAAENEPTVRDRLELVAKICDAVQHAHLKGVIHRDLKPGNILVDETGRPKVLDFGVARATDADMQTVTMQTGAGQLIGTLPYMSPEQVTGDSRLLDTRSDVYALGVILYELLSGELPHDVRNRSIAEAARIIRDEEPSRLSSIKTRVPGLGGEVETIVVKAMEKDKARRYQSASDLAGDIRRYLANVPILARPPSALYQLRKFAKRNKALVGAVSIAIAALTWAMIDVTLERNRALRAERVAEQQRAEAQMHQAEAERQAAIAQAVNDFMERTLSSVDPSQTLGRDVPFRSFLDLAADRIETELRGQPSVQALVYNTLGRSYRKLGFPDDAESHLRRGLALSRSLPGEQRSLELDIMNHLALTLQDQGNLTEAEPLFREILNVRQRTLGDEDERTILAINNLGWLLRSRGQFEEARNLFRQALALRRKVSGEDHVETLRTMVNLASVLRRLGNMEEAERLSVEAVTACERTLGDKHPLTLYAMSDRVWLLKYSDRSKEAEVLARRTLELSRQVLGDDHPSTLNAMNTLAVVLSDRGLVDEAEMLERETLDARRRVLGEEHLATLASMNNLAVTLYTRGEVNEAGSLYTRVLEARRRSLGDEHPATLSAMYNLALALREQLKLDEAEPLFTEVLAARRRARGDEHPSTLNCMTALGALYAKQNRHDQSAPLYEEAWKAYQRLRGKDHVATLGSLQGLIASLIELGRFEDAEPLANECYERREATLGPSHRQTRKAVQLLINLYEAWGKPDRAARWQARVPAAGKGLIEKQAVSKND